MRVLRRWVLAWIGAVPVLIAGGVTPHPAAAQAVGPEIPIWVDSVSSFRPDVAFNINHEEFLVVWYNIHGPSTADIYARRVDIDGGLETWFAIFSTPTNYSFHPSVAFNPALDEYLVAWTYVYAIDDDDILGSLVAWDGSSIGSPFVIVNDPELQTNPDVVFNPNDSEFLVVYNNQWSITGADVAAQRIDDEGNLLSWANIATGVSELRREPRAAFSPEQSKYLIAYLREEVGGPDVDVVGKTAPPDLLGVSVAPEIDIADDATEIAANPAVGASADGFTVTFEYGGYSRARRVAADGSPLGPATGFGVGDATSSGTSIPDRSSAIARADAVGAVMAHHRRTGSDWDVFAQAVSPFSDRVLSEVLTLADSTAYEREAEIACAPWGTCLVVYERDSDVVGRIIRFGVFADGFDETGDTGRWSSVVP